MILHSEITTISLHALIKMGNIRFAGNRRLKIYGRLDCYSGKRIKRENRVFFADEAEAIQARFRPCGNCMKVKT